MAQEATQTGQPEAEAAGTRRRPHWLRLVLIVLVLGLAAAAALLFLGPRGPSTKAGAGGKPAPAPKEEPTTIVRLPTFIVNVLDPNSGRGRSLAFLKLTVALRCAGAATGKGEEPPHGGGPHNPGLGTEPGSGLPPEQEVVVKDAIITVLSAQDVSTLSTPAGKDALRASILAKLQHKVPELKVKEVLYEDFVMQ